MFYHVFFCQISQQELFLSLFLSLFIILSITCILHLSQLACVIHLNIYTHLHTHIRTHTVKGASQAGCLCSAQFSQTFTLDHSPLALAYSPLEKKGGRARGWAALPSRVS